MLLGNSKPILNIYYVDCNIRKKYICKNIKYPAVTRTFPLCVHLQNVNRHVIKRTCICHRDFCLSKKKFMHRRSVLVKRNYEQMTTAFSNFELVAAISLSWAALEWNDISKWLHSIFMFIFCFSIFSPFCLLCLCFGIPTNKPHKCISNRKTTTLCERVNPNS